jgi:general secretion pathway protein A
MYEKFFQLKYSPFNLTPDPQFFFFSRHHEEAFSQIIYGIQQRKGFILITGEVGTGKTTLCRLLLEHLDRQVKTALIFNPNLSTIELLQAINQDFGIDGQSHTKKALLDELNRYLLGALSRGENAVVIVDEAQNLSVECLEEIRMLSNLETTSEKLLQIVLMGQPELRQKLGISSLRQLNQRIALRYHLQPLDLEMAREYVHFRLRVAGGIDQVHFTSSAVQSIHQFSQGIPRLINIICDKALLAAYVSESKVITPSVIKTALADLVPMSSHQTSLRSYFPITVWNHRMLWAGGILVTFLGLGFVGWWSVMNYPASESARSVATLTEPVREVFPSQTEDRTVDVQAASGPPAHTLSVMPSPSVLEVSKGSDATLLPSVQTVSYAFDSDGVFRVEDPEEAERAAYLTLARLWQVAAGEEIAITPQEFKGMDTPRLLNRWGLYQYPMPSEYQKILALAYPSVVWIQEKEGTQPQPAVLSAILKDRLTLLDPLAGKIQLSFEEFQKGFTGKGVLLWREIPGISLPLAQGVSDTSVRTLQAILKVWGLYAGPVDGVLGTLTQTAIKTFQHERGLETTGQVGMDTYLLLAQAILTHKVPTISNSLSP